jgi:hypothetical protein
LHQIHAPLYPLFAGEHAFLEVGHTANILLTCFGDVVGEAVKLNLPRRELSRVRRLLRLVRKEESEMV